VKLFALVAQFPVSLSIQQNLESILAILEQAHTGDLMLFPEGSLSGYSHDLTFLDQIDLQELESARQQLRLAAQQRELHLWVGAVIPEGESWFNLAYGFTPQGGMHIYRKINLAHHERDILTPGDDLPVFTLTTPQGSFKVGVQICREIRYPEQWGLLARQGAQVILHLNNAIDNAPQLPVWHSHLVSRAAETQRFVLSANNAAPTQLCPTMAVAPNGEILGEIVSLEQSILRMELDLSQVSDWYLNQCRNDIVEIASKVSN
jgi:predicted amidohydrolase